MILREGDLFTDSIPWDSSPFFTTICEKMFFTFSLSKSKFCSSLFPDLLRKPWLYSQGLTQKKNLDLRFQDPPIMFPPKKNTTSINDPRDPGSPENGFMEPQDYAFWR